MKTLNDIEEEISKKTEKSKKEVLAVTVGCNVTFSSSYNNDHENYWLDNKNHGAHAWQAKSSVLGNWIQVGCESPKYWTGAIIQGRGNLDQWVKTVIFSTTIDGSLWENIENGKVFAANQDCHAKVKIKFN